MLPPDPPVILKQHHSANPQETAPGSAAEGRPLPVPREFSRALKEMDVMPRTLTPTAAEFQSATDMELSFDKSAIAALTTTELGAMSCQELATVVEAADVPMLSSQTRQRLSLMDRATLERLAHLARRCCRHQGYGVAEPALATV